MINRKIRMMFALFGALSLAGASFADMTSQSENEKDPVYRLAKKILETSRSGYPIGYSNDVYDYAVTNGPMFPRYGGCGYTPGFMGPSNAQLSYADLASIGMKVVDCPEPVGQCDWVHTHPKLTNLCFPSMLVEWTPDIQRWVESPEFKKWQELVKANPEEAKATIGEKFVPHAITRNQVMKAVKLAQETYYLRVEQRDLIKEGHGLKEFAEEKNRENARKECEKRTGIRSAELKIDWAGESKDPSTTRVILDCDKVGQLDTLGLLDAKPAH